MVRPVKLPKHVQAFVDRHGRPRCYYRRAGFPLTPLNGLPWSPQFMADYEQAAAGEQPTPKSRPSARIKPGTFRALALSYYGSTAFHAMREITQYERRRIIENFCEEKDALGGCLGDKNPQGFKREHVVKLLDRRKDRPGSASGLRKALRALMQHAVETGIRDDDPTRDVKAPRAKSDGHHSWTDGEIEQFRRHYAVGTRERRALELLLGTGQRVGDIVVMGRQHVSDGNISVRQAKTGAALTIPLLPELKTAIANVHGGLTFMTTRHGKPYTPGGFSNWFANLCDDAGLPHCRAHGLRKACARLLAEAGCSAHEIAAITGHATLAEITRYTRAVDQKQLASAAMAKVKKTRTATVKPARRV
jgi:integrase